MIWKSVWESLEIFENPERRDLVKTCLFQLSLKKSHTIDEKGFVWLTLMFFEARLRVWQEISLPLLYSSIGMHNNFSYRKKALALFKCSEITIIFDKIYATLSNNHNLKLIITYIILKLPSLKRSNFFQLTFLT